MHRKIVVLSIDYDPATTDDPAGWRWSALIDQPGTEVVAAGYVGTFNGNGTLTDEHDEELHING